MKKVIIDSRAPKKVTNSLTNLGFDIISLPCFSALPDPVSAHPDMLIFFADDKIFCHRDYYTIAKNEINEISRSGYEIILSNEYVSQEYPHDILFNSVIINGNIYGKRTYMSHLIHTFAENNDMNIIDVNQGYTKCSVCKISENAIITADPSIYKATTSDQIDALFISSGYVSLSGYDCGFIGGCSGICEDKIYFSGNIFLHPDGKKISDFCEKHNKTPISLSDDILFDIGSMFFI